MGKRSAKPPKGSIWKSRLFWCVTIPLLGFALILGGNALYQRTKQQSVAEASSATAAAPMEAPSAAPMPSPSQPPSPTPAPTPEPRYLPVRIYFAEPDLEAEVFPMGVVNGEIGTRDSALEAAWFAEGCVPGEEGNCLINGHDVWKGETGPFDWLKSAKRGDRVTVEVEDGTRYHYAVSQVEEQPYDEFNRYHMYPYGEERLTLITCKGDYDRVAGTSLTRMVVVCLPASPYTTAPTPAPKTEAS